MAAVAAGRPAATTARVTRPRALFFGTPDFAVPCLDALAAIMDVVTVVTQPDRPRGRGLELAPPPVKVRAEALGVPVIQPVKVRTPEFAASLRALDADVAVVVAYGRILPRAVLEAPRLGCVNVHASLLPRWRGAAPIQWAIARGDAETGVCLMQMDEGLDTGPVLARRATPIGPDETAGELAPRLAALGAELLREALPRHLAGALVPVPQDDVRHTLAPILEKAHGAIDWAQRAQAVHDLVRGMSPWPGAFTRTPAGGSLKVHATRVVALPGMMGEGAAAVPGTVLSADRAGGLVVACGSGAAALVEVQPEGKRRMSAADYLAGRPLACGDVLGARREGSQGP